MINRDSRGRLYSAVRGEILGFAEDKLLRKHSSRMFSLISERKLGDRRRLFGRPQSVLVGGRCPHGHTNKLLGLPRVLPRQNPQPSSSRSAVYRLDVGGRLPREPSAI